MSKVFVEGQTDFRLIKALGISRKNSKVLDNKGNVCNYLEENEQIIGLVDEDPQQDAPKYLRKLLIEELTHNLLLYKDSKRNNKSIAIRPRLEEWLLKICRDAKIKLSDFGIPEKPKELHDFLPRHLSKLEELVAHLLELEIPAILFLQEHLQEDMTR